MLIYIDNFVLCCIYLKFIAKSCYTLAFVSTLQTIYVMMDLRICVLHNIPSLSGVMIEGPTLKFLLYSGAQDSLALGA